MTIPVLIIVGPTASGKSDLAVRIAEHIQTSYPLGAEIVSADSRQVYTGLNIGTGKITKREMKGIPHHLLDVADPRIPANSPRTYNVEKWKAAAEKAIADIHARGKLPIICGGTGFYISALIDGFTFPDVPPNKKLRASLSQKNAAELFTTLTKLDPHRARVMKYGSSGKKHGVGHGDDKNIPRLIRAIEIATALGKVPPLLKKKKEKGKNAGNKTSVKYDPIFIGISVPPDVLKNRIDIRLKKRFRRGMIEEVENLHMKPPRGLGLSYKRLNELGLEYRYIAQFLQGKIPDKKALHAILLQEIYQYAKRQMTWWKRDSRIQWFPLSSQISPHKRQ